MFFDPRALFMLVVLVVVTGFVGKNLMMAFYRLNKGEQSIRNDGTTEMEERLRKIEAATSSLLVDMSSMKEKQRFMARLQSGSAPREVSAAERSVEGEISPMKTQSIPIIPRVGSPRV
ncbi:MAG: hypothetical protein ABIZ36_00570 [Gemmatimonadaceae bacterium]